MDPLLVQALPILPIACYGLIFLLAFKGHNLIKASLLSLLIFCLGSLILSLVDAPVFIPFAVHVFPAFPFTLVGFALAGVWLREATIHQTRKR